MTPDLHAHLGTAAQIAAALAIGLLLGLEREWSNKDLGVRTFALTTLAAAVAAEVSLALGVAVLAGVLALIGLVNLRELRTRQTVEITTSAALLLAYVLGVAVGRGMLFGPLAAAILGTLLLAWKAELLRFAGRLQVAEIRAALWLAVLAVVIYPLLPNRPIDRWGLVNLHTVWVAVIVVGAIAFGNYILVRVYSERGLLYGAVLGGAVSSAATAVELGGELRQAAAADPEAARIGPTLALLDSLAMLARNALLLAVFAAVALRSGGAALAAMAAVAAGLAFLRRPPARNAAPLHLDSPVSFKRVFEFGALFLAVQVAGTLGHQYFGRTGFYVVSVIGGIFNSASTTVAAGELVRNHTLQASTAGIATVLASMTSAAANSLLFNRNLRDRPAARRLWLYTAIMLAAGAAALALR